MKPTGQFSWNSMGKPDYSQVAGLVASLPPDIRNGLTKTAEEVLRRLIYLMWRNAYHSGRGKPYAWPSESYLARVVARCERTVRRALSLLTEHGLLDITHRRKQGDCWQSNLYTAGKRFLATLYARASHKFSNKIRPDKNVHLEPKEGTRSPGNKGSIVEVDVAAKESPLSDPFGTTCHGSEEASAEVGKIGFASILSAVSAAIGKTPEEKAAEAARKQEQQRKYWLDLNPHYKPA